MLRTEWGGRGRARAALRRLPDHPSAHPPGPLPAQQRRHARARPVLPAGGRGEQRRAHRRCSAHAATCCCVAAVWSALLARALVSGGRRRCPTPPRHTSNTHPCCCAGAVVVGFNTSGDGIEETWRNQVGGLLAVLKGADSTHRRPQRRRRRRRRLGGLLDQASTALAQRPTHAALPLGRTRTRPRRSWSTRRRPGTGSERGGTHCVAAGCDARPSPP